MVGARRRWFHSVSVPCLSVLAVFSGSLFFYLTLALFTYASYIAFYVLGLPLVSLVAYISAICVAVSGGIAVFNALSAPARKAPLPQLEVDAVSVGTFFNFLGGSVVALLDGANAVLSWRDSFASARCLAYIWLVATFAGWLTPGWLLLCTLLRTHVHCAWRGEARL